MRTGHEGQLIIAIMAGGLGKRMKSDIPKVLHLVDGKPILVHVIRSALQLISNYDEDIAKMYIIVGKYAPIIRETLAKYLTHEELSYVDYVYQMPALGTGHAVQQVLPHVALYPENSRVMVLSGDVPLITPKTLHGLLDTYDYFRNADAVLITTVLDNPTNNGRIVRNAHDGEFLGIVEEKDCKTSAELNIKEVNAGIYLFHAGSLLDNLPKINNNNAQKEYYLPDVLALMQQGGKRGGSVVTYILEKCNQWELLNVNDREGLQQAQEIITSLQK